MASQVSPHSCFHLHRVEANGAVPLLFIDDSENDRCIVEAAIRLTDTPFDFYGADCIESANQYFDSHGQNSNPFPRPALVLLDYDLGRHTGVDFLHWFRGLKQISSIPVVVFSGAVGSINVADCYATGANYFISKPKDLERLKIIVRTLYVSVTSLHRPGPIVLLQEYVPDPRKVSTSD